MNKCIGALLLLGFLSCRNAAHKTGEGKATVDQDTVKTRTPKLVDAKVQGIYDDYITLKNALVATNYKAAGTASKALGAKLSAYAGCENTALIADKITNAGNIEEQRKEFTFLSSDVIAMFKHADLQQGTIYVQHCPMANHGDGGDWLSSEKKIQNPYYGSKMMGCGGVVEEIKK